MTGTDLYWIQVSAVCTVNISLNVALRHSFTGIAQSGSRTAKKTLSFWIFSGGTLRLRQGVQ